MDVKNVKYDIIVSRIYYLFCQGIYVWRKVDNVFIKNKDSRTDPWGMLSFVVPTLTEKSEHHQTILFQTYPFLSVRQDVNDCAAVVECYKTVMQPEFCHDLHSQESRPRRRKFLQKFLFLFRVFIYLFIYLFIYNKTGCNVHIM